jgi:branched-chain amino acid transport system permease protein
MFRFMQDWLSSITPQYWQFWIGLVLVVLVLVGHERITKGVVGAVAAIVKRAKR